MENQPLGAVARITIADPNTNTGIQRLTEEVRKRLSRKEEEEWRRLGREIEAQIQALNNDLGLIYAKLGEKAPTTKVMRPHKTTPRVVTAKIEEAIMDILRGSPEAVGSADLIKRVQQMVPEAEVPSIKWARVRMRKEGKVACNGRTVNAVWYPAAKAR